jgi:uncharacterized protein YihD (DUF1040 family)
MNAEDQKEVIALLARRWSEQPDLSFGEMVAQLTYLAAGHTETSYVEDAAYLKALREGWQRT